MLYLHAIFELMKRFFIIIFLISLSKLNAQINEIGVFLGGSNFIGDIGKTNYVDPNEFAFGFLYKWNKSPLLSSQKQRNKKKSKIRRKMKRKWFKINYLPNNY